MHSVREEVGLAYSWFSSSSIDLACGLADSITSSLLGGDSFLLRPNPAADTDAFKFLSAVARNLSNPLLLHVYHNLQFHLYGLACGILANGLRAPLDA